MNAPAKTAAAAPFDLADLAVARRARACRPRLDGCRSLEVARDGPAGRRFLAELPRPPPVFALGASGVRFPLHRRVSRPTGPPRAPRPSMPPPATPGRRAAARPGAGARRGRGGPAGRRASDEPRRRGRAPPARAWPGSTPPAPELRARRDRRVPVPRPPLPGGGPTRSAPRHGRYRGARRRRPPRLLVQRGASCWASSRRARARFAADFIRRCSPTAAPATDRRGSEEPRAATPHCSACATSPPSARGRCSRSPRPGEAPAGRAAASLAAARRLRPC